MRLLLIVLLAALSTWLLKERSELKEQTGVLTAKLATTQTDLENIQKKLGVAVSDLDKLSPAHAEAAAKLTAAQQELLAKQQELERLGAPKSKTWLQERIESNTDSLSRPPTPTYPYPGTRPITPGSRVIR